MIHVRIGNSLLFNDNRGHGIGEVNDGYFVTVDHRSNGNDKFFGDEPDLGVFIRRMEAFAKDEAFFESVYSRDFNVFHSLRREKGWVILCSKTGGKTEDYWTSQSGKIKRKA